MTEFLYPVGRPGLVLVTFQLWVVALKAGELHLGAGLDHRLAVAVEEYVAVLAVPGSELLTCNHNDTVDTVSEEHTVCVCVRVCARVCVCVCVTVR